MRRAVLHTGNVCNASLGSSPLVTHPATHQLLARHASPLSQSNTLAFALGTRNFSSIDGLNQQVAAVLGAQWGDEGKGKLVDILAKEYDIIARFNGGANAGHTLVVDGKKFAFHLLPCGMLYKGKKNLIGNGVVLHTPTLFRELKNLTDAGIDWSNRLLISDRAHLLFDFHMTIDGMMEEARNKKGNSIGTTRKGIGPCYASKINRIGIRVGELEDWETFQQKYRTLVGLVEAQYGFKHDSEEELRRYKEYRVRLLPLMVDSVSMLAKALRDGESILAEGANAALLDIDLGTYPYVTSSPTTVGGIAQGLGLAPRHIQALIGVVKAYTTRVGEGPFPTELKDDTGEAMRKVGGEFGTTTGRPRRCGWLDIPVVQFSNAVNGYTSINITKLDVLSIFKELKIGVSYEMKGRKLPPGEMPSTLEKLGQVKTVYETVPGWHCDISKARSWDDLPENAQNYVKRVSELCGLPVSWVGVGPGRDAMILVPV
eukprot:gb/GEZN01006490.1/.p1 GENE.gb/GEZN01006490.1/~~gb/GEZN01006490.1/.p1  ORF type:complete len:486 (-),score=66.08 gb/GEZN01006490.1/:168-1625(-)